MYFTVRHSVDASWLNDRDQFIEPNNEWKNDIDFKNDCLAFSLFHSQNKVSILEKSTNHWIPFTEYEVDAQDRFESHFMTDFIKGKLKMEGNGTLLEKEKHRTTPLQFSAEATAVFDAGRELWKYYHKQPNVNANASFYDIRAYFQGRNSKGRMNPKSDDKKYTQLIDNLRDKLKILAQKIEPKVYEFEFLKR